MAFLRQASDFESLAYLLREIARMRRGITEVVPDMPARPLSNDRVAHHGQEPFADNDRRQNEQQDQRDLQPAINDGSLGWLFSGVGAQTTRLPEVRSNGCSLSRWMLNVS
jgi:hypothetical protein